MDDFAHLLAPVSPADFIARVWQREPLLIPGNPDKVARWKLDRTSFFDLVAAQAEPEGRVRLQFHDADGRHREQVIEGRLAKTMFEAGMTITVARLDTADPRLRELARSAKQSLGHCGQVYVNAFASPEGKGFGLHFDSKSAFIIQLDGQKHWRHSRAPAIPSPPENVIAEPAELERFQRSHPWAEITIPKQEALAEQLLRPGDVLYLPAGTWHSARAEGHSVALTLTVAPLSARELLLEALSRRLVADPEWRQFIPLAPPATLPAAGLPVAIEQFLAGRLEQLRRHIGELTPAELGIQWRTDLAETPSGAPPAAVELDITPSDVLRVAEPSGLIDNPRNQTVALFAGSAKMELPADNRTFLRHLVERRTFVAQDATRFCDANETLDWDEVREALQLLAQAGALVITGRPA